MRVRTAASVAAALASAAIGCSPPPGASRKENARMTTLTIRWRRLVDETGRTCERCGSTGEELRRAVETLGWSLAPLGMAVVLEEEALDLAAFEQSPLESNRIWVAGKPLEEWLGAGVGQSECCAPCGDAECRTVTVKGRTYEAIPAELIVKAGLLAAAASVGPGEPCCESGAPAGGCCPRATNGTRCCD